MRLIRFFFVHSLRDMGRNRMRTAFALVCVATGVATIVALRSLAFMVGDELTTNLAEQNRGDIRIRASRQVPDLVEMTDMRNTVFTADAVAVIEQWAAEESVDITLARLREVGQPRPVTGGNATSRPVMELYVEPEEYPYYGEIVLQEPAGQTLADVFGDTTEIEALASAALPQLGTFGATAAAIPGSMAAPSPLPDSSFTTFIMTHPRPVVIAERLKREKSSLGLEMGDIVQFGESNTFYEVRGVVADDAESLFIVPETVFLGYAYLPLTDLPLLGEPVLPDHVFVRLPYGANDRSYENSLIKHLYAAFGDETNLEEQLPRYTVSQMKEDGEDVADLIDDMILVMGLSSLLIGGIGIINTMLVVVSRRTLEIAVLKTLGLKGYRVTLLFLVESLLMGLIGSALGSLLGVLLSYFILGIGEEAFRLTLEWRVYPEVIFSGIFLGVVVTVLFGFLPTLVAGQVRPAIVLRPNEAQMPAAGLLQTLATLVVMIVVLGALVNTVIEGAFSFGVDIGPLLMLMGAGGLVGLFAGIIIANTQLGKPIPDYYRFGLSRRFEQLENWITGGAGSVVGWLPLRQWEPHSRREKGRAALTGTLRGVRQVMLMYGALAIGAVLASLTLLITSEIWKPFGLGDSKPANDIFAALAGGDLVWVLAWSLITLSIGLLIRWMARGLLVIGIIALGSLGATLGGVVGWLTGYLLQSTSLWGELEDFSTGLVLIEGALVVLGAIYVGYWLLVWLVSKMPAGLLMGIVSITLAVTAAAAGLAISGAGAGTISLVAALGLGMAAAALLVAQRRKRQQISQQLSSPAEKSLSRVSQVAVQGSPVVMLSAVLVVGGVLVANGLMLGLLAIVLVVGGLWWHLRRRYRIDGRLILREMSGRRGRVASTLLGLSVGLAGLSLVSLTTDAVSHLIEVQLGDNTEGNLLVTGLGGEKQDVIRSMLEDGQTRGAVEHFAQFTNYQTTLLTINGEEVQPWSRESEFDPDEEQEENEDKGLGLSVSVRDPDELPEYRMQSGRQLTTTDVGLRVMMLRESAITDRYDISVGDSLFFEFENGLDDEDNEGVHFQVVGIISRNSEQTGLEELGTVLIIPPGITVLQDIQPEATVAVVTVNDRSDRYMDEMLVEASKNGLIALETDQITEWIENLLSQLRAIPTLVAWLTLFAGTAIIANMVALATQERRRQIGVMKAVGLKGRRVLVMLMIENGLVGLIAGMIGNAIGLITTVVLVLTVDSPDEVQNTIQLETVGLLVLMSIGVAVLAALVSAWTAAAEKPMSVLRYE
ncbi:MAG: ABC transporter permease [Chloroflexi bacterium]|nr:ABC transporter permease [Chloroflexota bacterium]